MKPIVKEALEKIVEKLKQEQRKSDDKFDFRRSDELEAAREYIEAALKEGE